MHEKYFTQDVVEDGNVRLSSQSQLCLTEIGIIGTIGYCRFKGIESGICCDNAREQVRTGISSILKVFWRIE